MKFTELIDSYDWQETTSRIYGATKADVETALSKQQLEPEDFMALISPAAAAYLEPMASLSRSLTLARFGRTTQLYIPLYLTNSCINHCVYCGFNHDNDIRRIILTEDQIRQEVEAIRALGDFRHILLVTGENPRAAGADYIERAVEIVRSYFPSISVEVQPLKTEEYARLSKAGMNAVYCYQETYNKARYGVYHPRGMKADFNWRLDTFDRMGAAGVRKMGLGVLIGLEDWRTDAAFMARHLRYLERTWWRTRYSVSFPRMRPHEGAFQPRVVMSDAELAQLIFAYRIFDHDLEIALSTREQADFRNHMLTMGVTSISAGSKTDPGGYAVFKDSLEQFAVADDRSPEAVLADIRAAGYEPVWKDWDLSLQ